MRIGLVNIYSFRPHVEHLYYLASVLEQAGHETFFLTCDSSVPTCYPRLLKRSPRALECTKCILGGVRSYPMSPVQSIGRKGSDLSREEALELALSSSATLARTEHEDEWYEPEVVALREQLLESVSQTYSSACEWINRYSLEGVICFNGRMDLPRAVIHACETLGVPYVTHERTWFGDGLQLIPNGNCLSLKELSRLVGVYDERPLTESQARTAAKLAADRFLQQNTREWRLYNKNPESIDWPGQGAGKRVLILPSSKSEFSGHPDWASAWKDNTQALDDFFEIHGIDLGNVVLRCHPNWAERIGKVSGDRSWRLYDSWAKRRGIKSIQSDEKASTYDLIQQADVVVLNGGSSAVEAGICGKEVVCLGPSTYQAAGFVRTYRSRQEILDALDLPPIPADVVIRKTLRFLYLRYRRFPQYVDYVRCDETTRYRYYQGADATQVIEALKTGQLIPDDDDYADSEAHETALMRDIKSRNWQALAAHDFPFPELTEKSLQRRPLLRWVDRARRLRPRGDQG
jgi:hypothetical protein